MAVFRADETTVSIAIHAGDCRTILPSLPSGSVRCCVTSPPYWALRDYGVDQQIGLESTPEEYVDQIVAVFREVRRVLADDGTLWLNLGDTYSQGGRGGVGDKSRLQGGQHNQNESRRAREKRGRDRLSGYKPKDLIGIPWMVAFALRNDGWYLRSDVVWHKPSAMPESVLDRPSRAHEYIFLLSKSRRYFYDADAVRSDLAPKTLTTFGTTRSVPDAQERLVKSHNYGRDVIERKPRMACNGTPAGANARTVWSISSEPYPEAHYATFPPAIVEPCILAGTSQYGHCPSCGSAWRRVVERQTVNRSNAALAGAMTVDGKGHPSDQVRKAMTSAWAQPAWWLTVGWEPGCGCGHDPVPDVVLDPFAGSGTTGMVADRLGRHAVLIDLNAGYALQALNRVREDAPLLVDARLIDGFLR